MAAPPAAAIGAILALRVLASVSPLPGQEAAIDPAIDPAADVQAVAPPELVTDRPDVTESTATVAPGLVQLETGAVVTRREDATSADFEGPGTLLRIGVTPHVEARLGWEGYANLAQAEPCSVRAGGCRTSGAGDAEAGLKLRLLERGQRIPDVSLLGAVTLPVGTEDVGSGSADPTLKALLAHAFSPAVGWGANAGISWTTESVADATPIEERTHAFSWSYSLGVEISPVLGTFLEYFGEAPEIGADLHSFDAGLTFLVGPEVQLDASGGVGLSDAAPDWFAGGGLSLRFAP